MKILHLDIDGVLNSVRSAEAYYGYPNSKRNYDKFDDVAVSLIRKLCKDLKVEICLSSTWRLYGNYKEIGKMLYLPINFETPRRLSGIRGQEIDLWLQNHEKDVEKYAIVDDNSDMLENQKPFFVQTNYLEGLSYKNYCDLRNILK